MGKKRVWKVGCALFLILLICTMLSVEIQKMMMIEVNVTQGKDIAEEERSFPSSALNEKDGTFYCAVKRKGDFREEYVVEKRNVSIIREEEDQIVIAGDIFFEDDGKKPLVIYHATHTLEEGDVVSISEMVFKSEEEEKQYVRERIEEQKLVLLCGIPVGIIALLLLVKAWRHLCMLYDGEWKNGLLGLLFLALTVLICKVYTNYLEIPRQMLPKESIFDIAFYKTLLWKE